METFREMMRAYRWLLLALLSMAAATAVITSCGGGGSSGGTDGALCQQCGDTDGLCQPTGLIVPGANEPAPCPTPPEPETCEARKLICRRKVDSAQRRCFPANESGTEVDFDFRCDGSRPGATLLPSTATPSPATPVPTVTKTPDPNAVCGNGEIEGIEQCDGINLNGEACGSFCQDPGGTLVCIGCVFDFSQCTGKPCAFVE
jgi:hypothetical protein